MAGQILKRVGQSATKPAQKKRKNAPPKSAPKPLSLAQSKAAVTKIVQQQVKKITAKVQQQRTIDKLVDRASRNLREEAAKNRFIAICLANHLCDSFSTASEFADMLVTQDWHSYSDEEIFALAHRLTMNAIAQNNALIQQKKRTSYADRKAPKYYL